MWYLLPRKMMKLTMIYCIRKLHYDYVICGGGSSGLALANRLVKSKYLQEKKIMLLDKSTEVDLFVKHTFPETINRVLLTNPCSVKLFKSIGIWDDLRTYGMNCIKNVEIWDEYTGNLELNSYNKNMDLCYMVDNSILMQLLYKHLLENISKFNLKFKFKTQINQMKIFKSTSNKDYVELILSDDSVVTTDLLIGCDGASSKVRELAKIETWQYDYHMTDHVGTVKYSTDVCGYTCFKKINPNGFVAFLTLAPGISSLSWCVSDPFGKELCSLSDEYFIYELNKFLAKKCNMPTLVDTCKTLFDQIMMGYKPGFIGGNITQFNNRPIQVDSIIPKSRLSYPLKLILAKTFVQDNVVLVGDAAHRINPITGQGLNLGFKDVLELANVLESSTLRGYNNFCPDLLKQYNNKRRADAALHIGFGTATNYLFTNESKLVGSLRSLGLSTANIFPFKDFIVNKAIN